MIKKRVVSNLPTKTGHWIITAYSDNDKAYSPHLSLVHEPLNIKDAHGILVRIHSECLTGDIFGSNRCDCGEQLAYAQKQISKEGGVLLYLRQEGRGIGIIEKLKAYNLQDGGIDTFKANEMLGHDADSRSYEIAIQILSELGVDKIRLMTNNPEKLKAFEGSPIKVVAREEIIIAPNSDNADYLKSKEVIMGHLLKSK